MSTLKQKQLSTTSHSLLIQTCGCGLLDSEMLKQKLNQILWTLEQQIESKNEQIKQLKYAHHQEIKQKDEIIERLVKSSENLQRENYLLIYRIKRNQANFQAKALAFEQKYSAKIKQMKTIIKYLQSKTNCKKIDHEQRYFMKKSMSPTSDTFNISTSKTEKSQLQLLSLYSKGSKLSQTKKDKINQDICYSSHSVSEQIEHSKRNSRSKSLFQSDE